MRDNVAITLIALIITVIVMLVLAGVVIGALNVENGIFTKMQDAKIKSMSSQIKEAIEIYKVNKIGETALENKELYPLAKTESGSYITLADMPIKEYLSEELKYILLNLSYSKQSTDIPTLDQIDYTKFYKIDTSKVDIPDEWKEKVVIYIDGNNYKVIHLEGVKYKNKLIYEIVPLEGELSAEYITINNSTYKLYADGTLKVLGELTNNSGITTQENSEINGWLEFKLAEINERFKCNIAINAEVETQDEYAKANGVKRIYFCTGTVYVIDANNILWAWGDNSYNKLGLGHSYLVTKPTKILEGRTGEIQEVKAKEVWAGISNTFIVDTQSRIWASGVNSTGTLGQGNYNKYDNWVEIKISGLTGDNIEYISVSNNASHSNAIIKSKEAIGGKVYVAGSNYYKQFGNIKNIDTNYLNQFIELSDLYVSASKIENFGSTCYLLLDNGDLYGCGYNRTGILGVGDKVDRKEPVFIMGNVKDVKMEHYSFATWLDKDGNLYTTGGNIDTYTKIDGFKDANATLLSGITILSNNKLYRILPQTISLLYNGANEKIESIGMWLAKKDGKVYGKYPDIMFPGIKSNYILRKIADETIYIRGNSRNVSLVKKNGDLYENLTEKNTEIRDVRKITVSNVSRFLITKDGSLYAKGSETTGMWGSFTAKESYIKITKNGTEYFDNVEEVFTLSGGSTAIILTADGKLYWAGNESYTLLPGIEGDAIPNGFANKVTYYPKEVSSNQLKQLEGKIKDVQYSYTSTGGIMDKTTLLTTIDGDLYVMSINENTSGLGKKVTDDFEKLMIKDNAKVKQTATLNGMNLALLENGEVYAWGYNEYGIMGDGYELGKIYPTPMKLKLNNIQYMSLGNGFAIFASETGEVYGIGKNDYGQLGTGDNTGASQFVRCIELEK